MTAGTQSDAVTKMIQNMGADIIVTAKVMTTTDTRQMCIRDRGSSDT